MSDAADEATSGQLVVSTAAHALLKSDASVTLRYRIAGSTTKERQFLLTDIGAFGNGGGAVEMGSGRNMLQAVSAKIDAAGEALLPALRCFVPAVIDEQVRVGISGLLLSSKRKLISVFMKVIGLGPNPCEVASLDTCQTAVLAVQEQLSKFDGINTRLICDDKGVRFLIAFGLPLHQDDDDEARAVKFAVEVYKELKKIPSVHAAAGTHTSQGLPRLSCAIGMTTGQAFCCEAGWPKYRVEYTLAGAKVNLAARLMQAVGKNEAMGREGVLVDEGTWRAAKLQGCEFDETLEPIKVKGKEGKVRIYRPLELMGRSARSTEMEGSSRKDRASAREGSVEAGVRPTRVRSIGGGHAVNTLVGREEELARMYKLIDGLRADAKAAATSSGGESGALVFVGESGMGKTHLVSARATRPALAHPPSTQSHAAHAALGREHRLSAANVVAQAPLVLQAPTRLIPLSFR